MSDQNFLNLKGKLNKRGPFEENEDRTIVFSVGNSNEGHGYALPRDIDGRQAMWVANNAANKAGARYIAHLPFSTDRVGDIAINWSPNYIPLDEFYSKSIKFMNFHIKTLQDYDISFEKIVLVNFHGGNIFPKKIINEMKKELGDYEVEAIGPFDLNFEVVDQNEFENWFKNQGIKPGHADTTEHSIASALVLVDYDKLKVMNDLIAKDINAALKRWPEIGGLGGYLEYGGSEFEPLRDPKYGLVACYEKFKKDKKIFIHRGLGQFILQGLIDTVAHACLI
ncbi:MAG: hypothetical protein GF329_08895 [Candidatus Lokiarchaeota archaeon]|nr:hypothetical protein [Candidatus Lokiarchaeota archaeon]